MAALRFSPFRFTDAHRARLTPPVPESIGIFFCFAILQVACDERFLKIFALQNGAVSQRSRMKKIRKRRFDVVCMRIEWRLLIFDSREKIRKKGELWF